MQEVWTTKEYYDEAGNASLDKKHPAIQRLIEIAKNSVSILDLGCGEGTRLSLLTNKSANGTGVDISMTAIRRAKKTHNKHNVSFKVDDIESLNFPDNSFDLVYSVSVLEHTDNPSKIIKEAIRVTKKGGRIFFFSPNYGSPNRSSPPFKGSRLKKLFFGFWDDILRLVIRQDGLSWNKVKPISTKQNYVSDWDTTIEPYIGSLMTYLRSNNIDIIEKSTCWSEELAHPKLIQKIFRFFAGIGIYPFYNWGPHFFVVGIKVNG